MEHMIDQNQPEIQRQQDTQQEPVYELTKYEKLLTELAAFRKKVRDSRMELQVLLDNEWGQFPDVKAEYAWKGIDMKERKLDLEYWLEKANLAKEEGELVQAFIQAGYTPWRTSKDEVRFIKTPPNTPTLSKEDALGLYSSWRGSIEEMKFEIDVLESEMSQTKEEIERITSEDEISELGSLPTSAGSSSTQFDVANLPTRLSEHAERLQEITTQHDRLEWHMKRLQDQLVKLLPAVKSFGYIPKSASPLARLVKQETIQ